MGPGYLVDSRYRLGRLIASGGVCDVWLAEDERLHRTVAVKIARPGTEWGDGFGDPRREAELVGGLLHSNIAAVHDAGHADGQAYVVMEYIDGPSLREHLQQNGPLNEAAAIALGLDVAAALAFAHGHGFIHNDVKPENILLAAPGAAKLADFGIAARFGATLAPDEARELVGTLAYIAPEVLEGHAPTAHSDTYALALTLYEAIAGRLPFSGATVVSAGQRLAGPIVPLRTIAPAASATLEAVLARELQMRPENRHASAVAFGQALEGALHAATRHDTRRIVAAVPAVVAASSALAAARRAAPSAVPAKAGALATAAAAAARTDPHLGRPHGKVGQRRAWAPTALLLVAVGLVTMLGGGAFISARMGADDPASVPPGASARDAAAAAARYARSLLASLHEAAPQPPASANAQPPARPGPALKPADGDNRSGHGGDDKKDKDDDWEGRRGGD
ncbi:MAG: serine/threonine-protein kinase [Tepidiformaceae bacterium]